MKQFIFYFCEVVLVDVCPVLGRGWSGWWEPTVGGSAALLHSLWSWRISAGACLCQVEVVSVFLWSQVKTLGCFHLNTVCCWVLRSQLHFETFCNFVLHEIEVLVWRGKKRSASSICWEVSAFWLKLLVCLQTGCKCQFSSENRRSCYGFQWIYGVYDTDFPLNLKRLSRNLDLIKD